jgi:hypothetical protein
MNRVYLSALFGHKDRILAYGHELAELGVESTSTWASETAHPGVQTHELPDHYLRHTAILDIHDMFRANRIVLFTPTDEEIAAVPKRSLSRGGRNFEAGFFYALIMLNAYLPPQISDKREFIICGQRETIFHWLSDMVPPADSVYGIKLPEIKQYDTWGEVKAYLSGGNVDQARAQAKQAKGIDAGGEGSAGA